MLLNRLLWGALAGGVYVFAAQGVETGLHDIEVQFGQVIAEGKIALQKDDRLCLKQHTFRLWEAMIATAPKIEGILKSNSLSLVLPVITNIIFHFYVFKTHLPAEAKEQLTSLPSYKKMQKDSPIFSGFVELFLEIARLLPMELAEARILSLESLADKFTPLPLGLSKTDVLRFLQEGQAKRVWLETLAPPSKLGDAKATSLSSESFPITKKDGPKEHSGMSRIKGGDLREKGQQKNSPPSSVSFMPLGGGHQDLISRAAKNLRWNHANFLEGPAPFSPSSGGTPSENGDFDGAFDVAFSSPDEQEKKSLREVGITQDEVDAALQKYPSQVVFLTLLGLSEMANTPEAWVQIKRLQKHVINKQQKDNAFMAP